MTLKICKFGKVGCGMCKLLDSQLKRSPVPVESYNLPENPYAGTLDPPAIPYTYLVDEDLNIIKEWKGPFRVSELINIVNNINK